MRTYRYVSLLIIAAALGFVIGLKVGEQRVSARLAATASDSEPCCTWPAAPRADTEPPTIPPVPGLPCVVQFGCDETEDCRAARLILEGMSGEMEGRASLVMVDTRLHPREADRWRLRMVPTQVFLDANGSEVSRHEGIITADETLAGLRAAGADLHQAPRGTD